MSISTKDYHMTNLKGDKNAYKYYEEINKIKKSQSYEKMEKLSVKWAMKKCAEFFFDEMDYFDGKLATLDSKANIFCNRMELVCMVTWSEALISLPGLYNDEYKKQYIEIWKKMLLEVNKTTIRIENYYGIRIRCAGDSDSDSVNLKHNITNFNEGYMTNIMNLSRKQLEIFVEQKKIEFQIALNNYEQEIFSQELKSENKRLEGQLNEHIVQYKKMKEAFEESQKANKALQEKVTAQDKLIVDLGNKMDSIINLFGWFKEEAPKQMLKSIMGPDFARIENVLHDST